MAARFVQRLFRHERDTRLPVILTQRRIFILPTRAGLLFAAVLLVMLIGAINYNLSLGHALVFLLAGIGLVAMVHTFRNLIDLRISPGRAEPVFAGETACFPIRLENSRRQARRALELAFSRGEQVSLHLAPEGQVTACLPYPAATRGWLDPGSITLATRYPLGLFYAWSTLHPPLTCLVYPKAIDSPLPPPLASQQGTSRGESGQEDFTGLRPHQVGESFRHIAWKTAARLADDAPLPVKQFAGGAAQTYCFDSAELPGDPEYRISRLTGWVLLADRQNLRYALHLPGRRIPPGQGRAHRDLCLETLALHGQHD